MPKTMSAEQLINPQAKSEFSFDPAPVLEAPKPAVVDAPVLQPSPEVNLPTPEDFDAPRLELVLPMEKKGIGKRIKDFFDRQKDLRDLRQALKEDVSHPFIKPTSKYQGERVGHFEDDDEYSRLERLNHDILFGPFEKPFSVQIDSLGGINSEFNPLRANVHFVWRNPEGEEISYRRYPSNRDSSERILYNLELTKKSKDLNFQIKVDRGSTLRGTLGQDTAFLGIEGIIEVKGLPKFEFDHPTKAAGLAYEMILKDMPGDFFRKGDDYFSLKDQELLERNKQAPDNHLTLYETLTQLPNLAKVKEAKGKLTVLCPKMVDRLSHGPYGRAVNDDVWYVEPDPNKAKYALKRKDSNFFVKPIKEFEFPQDQKADLIILVRDNFGFEDLETQQHLVDLLNPDGIILCYNWQDNLKAKALVGMPEMKLAGMFKVDPNSGEWVVDDNPARMDKVKQELLADTDETGFGKYVGKKLIFQKIK